jgi:AcrR family transcriptional regulator
VPDARKVRRRDDEVLEAAVKVFYERGYSDATIQDVADELGILKGSLYHYIANKEELLLRLVDVLHADGERTLAEVAAADGLDPLQRLDLYVRRQVLYNLEHLERISIYYRDLKRLGERGREAVVARRRAQEQWVSELIGEAQDAGLADPGVDAKLVTNCVFATINWCYRWYRPDGPFSGEEIAAMCSDFVLGGVAGDALTLPA